MPDLTRKIRSRWIMSISTEKLLRVVLAGEETDILITLTDLKLPWRIQMRKHARNWRIKYCLQNSWQILYLLLIMHQSANSMLLFWISLLMLLEKRIRKRNSLRMFCIPREMFLTALKTRWLFLKCVSWSEALSWRWSITRKKKPIK